MADNGQVRVQALLARLMPPPAPSVGWGAARIEAEAQAVGVMAVDQIEAAESQMVLGASATLTSGTWAGNEFGWGFTIQAQHGASDNWADTWGATLSTPRNHNERGEPAEQDPSYSRRILSELTRPTSTNLGMAQAIDEFLGISGTQVVDTSIYFSSFRLNDGHQMNTSVRLVSVAQADGAWCLFTVVIPGATIPVGHTETNIYDFVNRRRAAGTRCLGIIYGSVITPYVSSKSDEEKATSTTAKIMGYSVASDITWTATGGTITAGQGTDTVTVTTGTGEATVLHSAWTESGVAKSATRTISLYDPLEAYGVAFESYLADAYTVDGGAL